MVNVLVVAFLLLHGAVHLGVWMPHPPAADGTPVPFEPDHSAVLSRASVGVGVERRIATALAYATAAAYVGAGLAVDGITRTSGEQTMKPFRVGFRCSTSAIRPILGGWAAIPQ